MITRRAARTDTTQTEAVALLRGAGWSVFVASSVGGGFPDLVVGKHGTTLLVEMKSGRGKLRDSQKRFVEEWRGSAVIVAYNAEEALEMCEGRLNANKS